MPEATDKVSITPVSDEDISTCMQILSKSFKHNEPFIDAWFPNHWTPSGQEQGTKRLKTLGTASPDSRFLKAVIPAAQGQEEQIIGFAIWKHEKEPMPSELDETEDVEEVWPHKNDREYMAQLWKDYVVPLNKAVEESGGKGAYILELIAVLPDYQGVGAGAALVKRGTDVAEKQRISSVVVGTPVARRLYEKGGMVPDAGKVRFEVGEGFGQFSGRRRPELTFFKREPRSQ